MRTNKRRLTREDEITLRRFQLAAAETELPGHKIAREAGISSATVSKLMRWGSNSLYDFTPDVLQAAKLWAAVADKTNEELDELISALEALRER